MNKILSQALKKAVSEYSPKVDNLKKENRPDLFALNNEMSEHMYNIGTGRQISIHDLAKKIQKIVGHKGKIIWDKSMPNGTPKKLLDISKMKSLGWVYSTELNDGIKKTYDWFLKNTNDLKKVKL